VIVEMPGGEAIINWTGEGDEIWLRGDAVKVFVGHLMWA
jgi:diaminopimelate epimerase